MVSESNESCEVREVTVRVRSILLLAGLVL